MAAFCEKYNLNTVRRLSINGIVCPQLADLGSTVQEIVEFSKGKSLLADIQREGIVVRCIRGGKKILSFKAINPDFLLKYD
jgi:hypothetical protein